MTADFGGARVVLLESRLAAETAAMVRRLGGEPVCAPSLAEVDVDADAGVAHVHRSPVGERASSVVVFLTGVAVDAAVRRRRSPGRVPRAGRRAWRRGRSSRAARSRPARSRGAACASSRTVAEPFTTTDVDRTRSRRCRRRPRRDASCTTASAASRSSSHLGARRARVHELMSLRVAAARRHRPAVAGDRRA